MNTYTVVIENSIFDRQRYEVVYADSVTEARDIILDSLNKDGDDFVADVALVLGDGSAIKI